VEKPNPTKLSEKKRIYTFPNNNIIVLENVTELIVSESGNHRIKTKSDEEISLHIIPTGWIHLEIKESEWTV